MKTLKHKVSKVQQGAVLFVSMVMLLVLSLFVATMVSGVGSEFMAQRNLQTREEMERAGLEAIEVVANAQTQFNNATNSPSTATATTVAINNYNVTVSAPVCYGSGTLSYSALSSVSSEDTYFDLTATVTDTGTFSSTQVQVTQGFRIRMPAGSCNTYATKSPNT